MKTGLIYLAGVATPFIALALLNSWHWLMDHRQWRRYERAWAKFSAEFDRLSDAEMAGCRSTWKAQRWRFDRYSSDRDRYFALRWNHGNTKDI